MSNPELTSKLKVKNPALSATEILFDADEPNTVYFPVEHRGKEYRVGHTFAPVSDSRYFQYWEEVANNLNKMAQRGGLSVDHMKPQIKLWDELVQARIGYKESVGWKEKVHILDKSNAVRILFLVTVPDEDQEKAAETDLIDDEDETSVIPLDCYQNGVLIGTSHTLRQETQSELDEFMAIDGNLPPKGQLASAVKKKTRAERLCDLYDAVCISQTGYVNRVPAWHKELVIVRFFQRQVLRMGKSLSY